MSLHQKPTMSKSAKERRQIIPRFDPGGSSAETNADTVANQKAHRRDRQPH
jgi:hypothetical protein